MSVTVVTSGGNLNVTTSQQVTGASQTATVENTDQSYQDTVEGGSTLVIPDITLTKFDDTTVTAVAAIDLDLGVIDPPADGAVENTDVSYSDTVASGGTLVIPDINITKNDDSVVTSPAAIDLDLRIIDPAADGVSENTDQTYQVNVASGTTVIIPDITITNLDDTTDTLPAATNLDVASYLGSPTWDNLATAFGRAYHFPIMDGATSYRTGDDASIEASTFGASVRAANAKKIFNSLASRLVLNNNNSFGNTNRWTDSAGTQLYDGTGGSINNYAVDNYTGLGWFITLQATAVWNTAIDNALASTVGGFSDWFVPSVQQQISISLFDSTNLLVMHIVNTSVGVATFSSTTLGSATTQAHYSEGVQRAVHFTNKTNSYQVALCRKHF